MYFFHLFPNFKFQPDYSATSTLTHQLEDDDGADAFIEPCKRYQLTTRTERYVDIAGLIVFGINRHGRLATSTYAWKCGWRKTMKVVQSIWSGKSDQDYLWTGS